ncbi:MAG: hypothetical protein WC212_08105, partial [Candidatus Delongbacteria bacterium]
GKSLQLEPDTQLDIERTNPFFNEYGEQSLPVSLPDTFENRIIINNPQLAGHKIKQIQRMVSICDNEYLMQSNMAILSAQENDAISASFYMNEGSFYSKMPATQLSKIFGSETIPGITTIENALAFCKSLLTQNDERLTIFPIAIDAEESDTKTWINRLESMDSQGVIQNESMPLNTLTGTPGFYNSFNRSTTVNEKSVTVPAGFYISPFIKATYLLKRIFSYFGYTIEDSMILSEEPFSKMVFLNQTMDTIVNGRICFSDIVPTCTCDDILNIYRIKFNCEFIPDEVQKTVKISFFREAAQAKAKVDLTNRLTSKIKLNFPETYKQVKLSSSSVVSDPSITLTDFESSYALLQKYPNTLLNRIDQNFYRIGFSNGVKILEKLSAGSVPYQVEATNDIDDKVSPDCIPVMVDTSRFSGSTDKVYTRQWGFHYVPVIYVGKANNLNSKIIYNEISTDADTSVSTDTVKQEPMLAFSYDANGSGFLLGTLSNYDYKGSRLWDYSLCYNGPDGLFEKFYREYDNLLRNSLHGTQVKLLLSKSEMQSIPAHEKILLKGHEYFINILKFQIGGNQEPIESELLTTQLFEPLDNAILENERFPYPAFYWKSILEQRTLTEAEYNASEYKGKTYETIYPAHPTQAGITYGIYRNAISFMSTYVLNTWTIISCANV